MMNDVFGSNIFSLTAMTAAISQQPYTPTMLADLALFEEEGINTTTAIIEFNKGTLQLVPVTPRNAPPASVPHDKRRAYPIMVPHLPQADGLLADAVQGVRAFGSDSQVDTVEAARDRQLAKMRRQIDYTIEAHRMAAIKGSFYDNTGTLVDLFSYFGVTQTTIAMNLDVATTKVRQRVQAAIDAMETALDGDAYNDVVVLCGKNFWSDLIEANSVKDTYQKALDGAALRNDPRLNLNFGGMVFMRYRGNSLVKVGDDEAFAIPRGVANLAITRFAPANYVETVNTMGLPYYAKSEPMDFGKGVQMESQSNPLNLITRPNAIIRLSRTN